MMNKITSKLPETQHHTLFTDQDIYLFKKGSHYRLYDKMGSHLITKNEIKGTYFSVWAPNAKEVSVIGDFNQWNPHTNPLFPRWDSSGIWEGFIPHVKEGALYKYWIESTSHSHHLEKTDPYAFRWQCPPKNASVVWDLDFQWKEEQWLKDREHINKLDKPISIYEMHLSSWRRHPEENQRTLTYLELAVELPQYLNEMGFTHVEFLPVMEYPFDGSWGYQTLGYFAPTSRFGTPQEFMMLIDSLHTHGIGVLLDWVPSHFPADMHGIGFFDGTHLYEHADERKGFHPDWKSYIFNYGRSEVVSFLISSALFWFDKYHIDGLRVDAVASMLYLDYSREDGEWIPNEHGGNENLEAISFMKELNTMIYQEYPHAQTAAEESTAWPMVSKPTYLGGLGFGMKWNMGWMHDTLKYFQKETVHRKFHHNDLLFSLLYAYNENFVLPLSHDEVVHGKASLLSKMPGDEWQQFANLRLLYGYMYAHPGKKLLFMGAEIGLWDEWNHEHSLSWHLLEYDHHKQIQNWVRDLNHLYRQEPAFYEQDFTHEGFEWIELADWEQSIISFMRKGKDQKDLVVCICNFTPVPRSDYKVGVPFSGCWKEILNSDSERYGGSNVGNNGVANTIEEPMHGHPQCLSLTVPPLAILVLKQ
jgi:1,4-alpha-glucan branching enzyme